MSQTNAGPKEAAAYVVAVVNHQAAADKQAAQVIGTDLAYHLAYALAFEEATKLASSLGLQVATKLSTTTTPEEERSATLSVQSIGYLTTTFYNDYLVLPQRKSDTSGFFMPEDYFRTSYGNLFVQNGKTVDETKAVLKNVLLFGVPVDFPKIVFTESSEYAGIESVTTVKPSAEAIQKLIDERHVEAKASDVSRCVVALAVTDKLQLLSEPIKSLLALSNALKLNVLFAIHIDDKPTYALLKLANVYLIIHDLGDKNPTAFSKGQRKELFALTKQKLQVVDGYAFLSDREGLPARQSLKHK